MLHKTLTSLNCVAANRHPELSRHESSGRADAICCASARGSFLGSPIKGNVDRYRLCRRSRCSKRSLQKTQAANYCGNHVRSRLFLPAASAGDRVDQASPVPPPLTRTSAHRQSPAGYAVLSWTQLRRGKGPEKGETSGLQRMRMAIDAAIVTDAAHRRMVTKTS